MTCVAFLPPMGFLVGGEDAQGGGPGVKHGVQAGMNSVVLFAAVGCGAGSSAIPVEIAGEDEGGGRATHGDDGKNGADDGAAENAHCGGKAEPQARDAAGEQLAAIPSLLGGGNGQ